jgi:hypothetical protein
LKHNRCGEPLAGVCRLPMPPIRLTDEQLDAIFRAARPLRVGDRDQFLQEVAAALQGQDLGDGAVYRAIREVQRRHHDPPQMDHLPQHRRAAR